jgi:lipopolysaccharide transport system permease protein
MSISSDKPCCVISPSSGWVAIDFRALWTYRELLYFLSLRDIKIRYKQTALGVSWALLQPLLTMIIFTLFFGRAARIPSDGHPYAVFVLAGILPWTFFSNSVVNSSNSLVGNSSLISKVYFPRMIMPGSAVLAGLVDFAVTLVLMLVVLSYSKISISTNILVLPFLLLLTMLLALAIGSFFSALNVKYRDVRYALPFLVQLGMFVTPIIYPSSLVPPKWRFALMLNPMASVVESFRTALLGGFFNWASLGIATVTTLVLLFSGAYYFRRVEKAFADII